MTHEVVMPVLGMNQDVGVIAEWNKKQGDFVRKGEVIMSVETDKAVLEIEALYDGYLSQVKYAEGVEIPVGDVVALLTEEAENVSEKIVNSEVQQSTLTESEDSQTTDLRIDNPRSQKYNALSLENTAHRVPVAGKGKILASPKAKQLAIQKGIDLADLVKQGKHQPLHAEDIIHCQSAPTAQSTRAYFSSQVSSEPFDKLFSHLQASQEGVEKPLLLIAFVTGAARYSGLFDDVICLKDCLTQRNIVDADIKGVSFAQELETHQEDHNQEIMYLWNLTGNDIDTFGVTTNEGVVVTICGMQTWSIQVSVDVNDNLEQALAFLKELVARLKEPLRQLL